MKKRDGSFDSYKDAHFSLVGHLDLGWLTFILLFRKKKTKKKQGWQREHVYSLKIT